MLCADATCGSSSHLPVRYMISHFISFLIAAYSPTSPGMCLLVAFLFRVAHLVCYRKMEMLCADATCGSSSHLPVRYMISHFISFLIAAYSPTSPGMCLLRCVPLSCRSFGLLQENGDALC